MELQDPEARPDSEEILIRRIAAGDRRAFEMLYRSWQKPLYGYFARRLGDVNVVEELVNDVMLEVWKGAKRFRGQSKLSTWLFGIAHHKSVNELRRRKLPVQDPDAAQDTPDPAGEPDGTVNQRNLKHFVQRALNSLSHEHREVVELTFYHDFSYQEISQIARCPVNTVKTRMFYAKKRLQEALEQMGIKGKAI